ncbi:MAG: S1 RNA-binding domain-containing protein [Anaerolineaceae bacterium]|nr:S1 RNA-binding domain-containing protein [Anaerolineaceae bacterium]
MVDSVMQIDSKEEEIQPRQHFTGTVKKVSMAAALVDIGSKKPAVLHVSQVVTSNRQPVKQMSDVFSVDQEVEVWVKRVDDEIIQLTQVKPLALPWRDIKDGMIVKGTIVRLETFGAFVEIGAERPGLVHISEITHSYVKTPGDKLKEGQEIEAVVLESNRKKRQIKLSIKALEPEPEVTEEQQEKRSKRNTGGGGRRGRKDDRQSVNKIMAEVNGSMDKSETAMGAALREAMETQSGEEVAVKGKKSKKASKGIQDDLLSRTLEQRS